MNKLKRHFISRYEIAQNQGICTKEFASEMGMPLREVYWRANDYRKHGLLVGNLKRCRADKTSQTEFKKLYMQAVVEGRDAIWIAQQTGQTKNAVKCQTYAIRQSGVDLPHLIKCRDKRCVRRDFKDAGAFI